MSIRPEQDLPHSTDPSSVKSEKSDIKSFLADGAALGASAMFTALIGLFGWLLAARITQPADVGHATAFVNGFILVAALAELGLGQAALLWLPEAGEHAPVLIRRIYVLVLCVCLVLAVVFSFVAPLQLGSVSPLWTRVVFVVAALAWMIFHVQDFVLTGIGAARWVPVENVSFGIVRIVLLVVLATTLGGAGIVLSWAISTAICTVAVTIALARSAGRVAGRRGRLPSRRQAAIAAGSVYVSTMGITLINNLVPILIVVRYGAATGAVFSVIWLGLSALDVAGLGFGNALVVRLRGRSWRTFTNAAIRVVPMFAVPLAVAALLAHPLLELFGTEYADSGQTMLRLVVLGALFRVVVVLVCAVHFGADRAPRMAVLQWLTAAALIALAVLAPVSSGLQLLGVGYVVVQLVLSAAAVADLWRTSQREVEPA